MGLVARVGTRVAGRYTSACLEVREALPVSRDFFGATPSQLAQGNSSVFNPPPSFCCNHATMQLGGIGVVARLRSCRKVSGRGVGTRCHNLNHQPSKQESSRLSGYIQGSTLIIDVIALGGHQNAPSQRIRPNQAQRSLPEIPKSSLTPGYRGYYSARRCVGY